MQRFIGKLFAVVLVWGWLTSTALGGPLITTGAVTVTLPSGGVYEVASEVSAGGAGYVYTYSVKNLTAVVRAFEFGIAETPDLYGLYTETNAQVSPGAGILLRDQPSIISYGPGNHNYTFTQLSDVVRVGITVQPGQTQVMSFEDPHLPTLADWEVRERSPRGGQRTNVQLGLGQVVAPSAVLPTTTTIQKAPEPTSLTLALFGVGGLAVNALRRRRRN